MATIRELFHSLGNKHNILTVGCGATKETVEECLKAEGLSKIVKDNLLEILKNLEQITNEALEADKIATEIHDRIYKIIDPDTGKPG
ncbi:MAG: hypothetical protein HZA27_03130 [Candidatus Omnitrophica bacterium]|nr:hypothetical protein [Candidatus Omnitrophota bacterium]